MASKRIFSMAINPGSGGDWPRVPVNPASRINKQEKFRNKDLAFIQF
jgi:hypothetical protein